MKISHLLNETTTSGSVAVVAKPMGEMQKRPTVKGLEPVEKIMSGKTKKTGKYANSLSESKVKEISLDLKKLQPKIFQEKYGRTHDQIRKILESVSKVSEAELQEDDLIIIPGRKSNRRTGFVPHDHSRVDHEVAMARSDLIACVKNAKAIYELIKNKSEQDGIEGWVQEKLIKANDYLNAVAEYYDEKMMHEMTAGVIAGGGVGESMAKGSEDTARQRQLERDKQRSTPAQKERNQAQREGLTRDKAGTYYAMEGVAEGSDLDQQAMSVADKLTSGKNLEKLQTMRHDSTVYRALDRYFAKNNIPENIYNRVANIVFKRINTQGVAEGLDPDTQRLEQEIRDALANGDDYTARSLAKMASTPDAKKYLQKIIRQEMYGTGPGQGGTMEGIVGQGVAEGKKVDRMVQHIKKSEIKAGESPEEAENIAWATVNKRGYLDNKNKKKGK